MSVRLSGSASNGATKADTVFRFRKNRFLPATSEVGPRVSPDLRFFQGWKVNWPVNASHERQTRLVRKCRKHHESITRVRNEKYLKNDEADAKPLRQSLAWPLRPVLRPSPVRYRLALPRLRCLLGRGRIVGAVSMAMSRIDRRAAKAVERKGLKGNWGDWRITDLPQGIPGGSGWCREVTSAWANNLYAVLVRPFYDENDNKVVHLAIRTASSLEPPWRDLQRIKNEVCGEEMTAVQVMPPVSELVDEADMYHIWVISGRLPFTLAYSREAVAA